MYCMNCGKNITDGSKFCPECGTPVQKKTQVQPTAPVQQAVPVQQAAPVQQSAPAKPVKVKKKHPILVIFILLFIVASIIVAINAPKQIAKEKRKKLKTYDYSSFTIDLPTGMEDDRNGYDMGNGNVFFTYHVDKNKAGLSATELAESWEEDIDQKSNFYNVDCNGDTLTYTRQDIAGLKYFEVSRFYIKDDEYFRITVAGGKDDESYLKELLDTVVIK